MPPTQEVAASRFNGEVSASQVIKQKNVVSCKNSRVNEGTISKENCSAMDG